MADKKVKPRIDTLNNILVKEEAKVYKTSTGVRVNLGVVFDMSGHYFEPYQIKHGVGKKVSVLAKENGVGVQDYILQQISKSYAPLYYSLNTITGYKCYVLFKVRVDLQGNTTVTFSYYDINSSDKDGNIIFSDLTTQLTSSNEQVIKTEFYSKVAFRVQQLLQLVV